MGRNNQEATNGWLTRWGIPLVVVLSALFTLYGTNTRVSNLEARVAGLQRQVDQLEMIDARIMELRRDVAEIEAVRAELIEAIQRAIRSARRSGR